MYDGRYIYYAPYANSSDIFHGRVLRYDTSLSFTNPSAWTSYEAGNTSGLATKGFNGANFDGRYVYFVPLYDGSVFHGRVLRYDTTGNFTNSTSWSAYDAGNTNGLSSKGYNFAVYDGICLYFVPFYNGIIRSGVVLRYNTTLDFTASASWTAYDASNTSGLATKGYVGGTFDGRYVYFSPFGNSLTVHGFALRYDTTGPFTSSSSWIAFNAGNTDGYTTKQCAGAVYVEPFVYFGPNGFGIPLRYDTTASFTSASSWTAFNTTMVAKGQGFSGVIYDNQRYIYYIPYTGYEKVVNLC